MNIKGISTSKGLAIGEVYIYTKKQIVVTDQSIGDVESELKKFSDALEQTKAQIAKLIEKTKINLGEKESQIFEAHLMMLEDDEVKTPIIDLIEGEKKNAPYAVKETFDGLRAIFESMDNAYMKERAADMKDLGERLVRNLLGIQNELELKAGSILFCEDLEPSDTAALDPKLVAGFVTEKGGKTSHSAIIAQGMGIPALTGISAEKAGLKNGNIVILDAIEGHLMLHPSTTECQNFEEKIAAYKEDILKYSAVKGKQVSTIDGYEIEIASNIADAEKAAFAVEEGADGVGLFRTEFLYMNRSSLPSVDEQFRAYKKALEAFGDKPVVIRTFDIGGDKQVDYLNLEKEMNPFLGYRAIRISLDRTEMFKDQLRALYMASPYGNLKIMFPMVATISEIKAIKALIEEVKAELNAQNKPYKEVELGIMVEIPVVAAMASQFAKHVDFFSIGTNDLLQYTVAVDRMNEKLAHLYNWYHPGLLNLIANVAEAAHDAGIWVGICGEAASDPKLLPFYVGIGIDELSMSVGKMAEVKWKVTQVKKSNCEAVVDTILGCETAEEVEALLEKF